MGSAEMWNDTAQLDGIRKMAASFFEAWNQHDISRIMPLFTENAEVVNSLGLWWRGLTEVTQGLQAMNAIGPTLELESVEAHLVAPDAAICIAIYTVGNFTQPDGRQMPEQKALSTFFMVNLTEGWRIAGAQTTAVNAEIIAQLQSKRSSGA